MRILVTGGTGTVGSHVVGALGASDAEVSVLTRDTGKTGSLPPGVSAVQGDLLDPKAVRRIFTGVDAVYLVNALSPTEAHEGLQAVCGMRLAGVRRIVYQSVHSADRVSYLPHFGAKVAIEHALRQSDIPFTILRPNHFFQNDAWSKDALLGPGIYPQPIGDVGLSRVDVRDIADAAAAALLTAGHEGQTYDIVGPEVLTGEDVAQVWSRVLGREIRYAGNDLDAWEQQSLQYLPEWMVFDVRLMFAHFQQHGLAGSEESVARLSRLIGHPPRSFEAYARETAAAWDVAPA